MRVHLGYPFWLRPFVLNGVAGVTFGSNVYLDPEVARMPVERVEAILRHEIAHVNQYRRVGVVLFLVRYLFEYVRNRARGLAPWDAYREISFEKEAFAEELGLDRAQWNA